MPVVNNPFKSLYGFQSPSFSVNAAGNLVAVDVTVNNITANDITADDITSDQASTTTLLVGAATNLLGTLAVAGVSTFTNTTAAQSLNIAAVKIAGGVAIQNNLLVNANSTFNNDLTIGEDLTVQNNIQVNDSLITDRITTINDGSTLTDLLIQPVRNVIFKTAGNASELGRIDATGSTVPVKNTSINNTSIGLTVASTAAFVSGTVVNTPTAANNITRKDYVDRTAVAFSVALGG